MNSSLFEAVALRLVPCIQRFFCLKITYEVHRKKCSFIKFNQIALLSDALKSLFLICRFLICFFKLLKSWPIAVLLAWLWKLVRITRFNENFWSFQTRKTPLEKLSVIFRPEKLTLAINILEFSRGILRSRGTLFENHCLTDKILFKGIIL